MEVDTVIQRSDNVEEASPQVEVDTVIQRSDNVEAIAKEPGVALNQKDLATRLGVNQSNVSRQKQRATFSEWSRKLDPDGFCWHYDPRSGLFNRGNLL